MIEGLVSIITPVYNGAEFLNRSIKSVLAQTYDKWELILIDDGSVDKSVQVIEKYLTDVRIKLLKNVQNSGISATRNRGVKDSKGEFIALLDQDDEWFPEKLTRQVNQLKELDESYGLIYSNTEVRFENGTIIERKKDLVPKPDVQSNLELMLLGNRIASPTVLIRKSVIDEIGSFDESILWGGDDYDLWIRIAQKYRFFYQEEVLCIRYEHQKNYSVDKKRMMSKTIELGEKYVELYGLDADFSRKLKANHLYRYGIESIKGKNIREGLKYILKSLLVSSQGFIRLRKTIENRFK